ncbi:TonB-dependent receptor [Flavobacterium akiainvivens]|uniref:TonB-dependent receptor n=1 Tax=Flavobacterium akiainvivens TaxID=1202724 RepID=A0A0M8M9W9_9FLAO|nr:TonB-dependent receptor [Flavobacterium akiainvivens]KOS05605.1 TonB-dependent receptor [Flavobacterium akiainvivens]SFQ35235.1 iron complex outermembrane recepter protein [Flavobacterium akiainvivens]
MKKKPKGIGLDIPLPKIDLKLKLTTLLFLVAMFNMKASSYAQSTVTLNLNNTTVEKVIEAIEQSTDFRFVYSLSDVELNRTVSIRVKNEEIAGVLKKIFKKTDTNYIVRGTQVMLKRTAPVFWPTLIQEPVKGRVVDEFGMPLPGATVMEDATRKTTVTDEDGNFEINVSGPDAVLSITYLGYQTKTFTASQNPGTIALVPDAAQMEELVVVGYTSTSKKDVTGAVGSISAKDMNQGAITSPLQLMSGKLAGVTVTQTGSEPGSAPYVRIRGISSLIGGSDPLVVVDGVQGDMNLLNQIAPGEIASMDVLKDASATAVYGSRGAAGVIIITTKKSKAGTTSVEFSANTSFDFIPKKLDMLSADQWWQQAQLNGVPASANHGSDTDWFDIMTQTGFTQNYNLSFGGGTDKFNYRASVTAILQDGVVIESNNKRYIGRLQATQKALDDRLKLTFNLNTGTSDINRMVASIGRASFTSNLITNAYLMRPTDPVYNTDGTYFTDPNVFQYLNPYAVSQTVTSEEQNDNFFGSLRADLDVVEGLTASWFGSWRKSSSSNGFFLPVESTSANAIDQKGFANISDNRTNEKLMNMSLNYRNTFGSHAIDVLGLYEWQNQMYQGNYSQARGFINDITTYNAMQLGDLSAVRPGDISSYKNDRTLVSFLGRVNYTFKERYLLTASLRRDASSVFGANHKWGNFPSASAAWQIEKEPFMANQTTFNELKLRVGYGVVGNQSGLGPQNSLSLVGANGVTYFGGQQITNFAISQNDNADLRWETKKQANIGVDFAMADNRLRGTVDVFTAKTDDLLFSYTVPQPPFPFPTIMANVGSLRNEGIEASLAYDVISTDDMSLTLAGNVTFLRNEVLSLSGSINGVPLNTNNVGWGPSTYLIEGQPIGVFNILQHESKTDQNAETVVDRDGNGIIDQGNTSPDRYLAGQSLPKYTFSFNPTFRYKDFDFSMLWRGSGGNKVYNGLRSALSYTENIGRSNILASAVPLGIYTSQYQSDLFLEDGSFIRLDNATIGYNLNVKDNKYIEGLRFSVTGSNLILITDYTGIDPELNFTGGNGAGGDNGIYPRTRTIALGLNVRFK